MAESARFKHGELYQIPPNALECNPELDKTCPPDPAMEERILERCREQGSIRPVSFRVREDGTLELISGVNRIRAARKAGLETIPAVCCLSDCLEAEVVENLLQPGLSPCQRAEAILQALAYGFGKQQIAAVLDVDVEDVRRTLELKRLPADIFEECRERPEYSFEELLAIARMEGEERQKTAFATYRLHLEELRKDRTKVERLYRESLEHLDALEGNLPFLDVLKAEPARYGKLKGRVAAISKRLDNWLTNRGLEA